MPDNKVARTTNSTLAFISIGMMESLFGYLRLGKVASVVTEPVICGFLNAFALFLIKSQVCVCTVCMYVCMYVCNFLLSIIPTMGTVVTQLYTVNILRATTITFQYSMYVCM